MSVSETDHALMQLETDGAPHVRTRTGFLQVYRENWSPDLSVERATWTTLREATDSEREMSASIGYARNFWLPSGDGAPYCALAARRMSDQLARVVYEYV